MESLPYTHSLKQKDHLLANYNIQNLTKKSYPVHGTNVVITYGDGVDPTNWRNMQDPDLENGVTDDMLDNDTVPDDQPTPDHVIDDLGFDPHDLDALIARFE